MEKGEKMTIEEYQLLNPDWDIEDECVLEFAEPDNGKEAKKNIEWVLENYPNYEILAIVMRSYYFGTVNW